MKASEIVRNVVKEKLVRGEVVASMTIRLVRGVEIVGTPLSSINKIVATGDDTRVFNGYCGAESGFVPVSTVAPTVLVTEIELQRTRKDTGRPPVLPSPWATPATAIRR